MDSFSQSEAGADRAYDCSLSRQPHTLAQAIDAFNSGTVRPDKVNNAKVLHLVGGPIHLVVRGSEEMESSQNRVYGGVVEFTLGVGKDIYDSGMTASCNHYQAFGRIQHERLIVRNIVLTQALRRLHAQRVRRVTPVSFRERPRHWPSKPCSCKDLRGMLMLNEASSRRFEFAPNREHRITFTAVSLRPAVENTLRNMDSRDRVGIFLLQFSTQRQQTTHMVAVKMSENNVLHIAQLHMQFASIFQDSVWTSAGINEDAVSVGFDQCREPPLPDASVCQHGREDRYFYRMNLGPLVRTGPYFLSCKNGVPQKDQEGETEEDSAELCSHGELGRVYAAFYSRCTQSIT